MARKSLKVDKCKLKKASTTKPTEAITSGANKVRPVNPVLHFDKLGAAGGDGRRIDLSKYYGKGFDELITSAYFTGISLLKHDNKLSQGTLHSYFSNGLAPFADYLSLWYHHLERELVLEDITSELIDNYITHLIGASGENSTHKNYYTRTKALLKAMHSSGQWKANPEYLNGLFPKNPFPHSNKHHGKGKHPPFTEHERHVITVALKQAVATLYSKKEPFTGYELTFCLLAVAMVTGINPSPLLNMTISALSDHPLKDNRKLLTVHKRRGNATHLYSLRQSEDIQIVQGIKLNAANLIEKVIAANAPCRKKLDNDAQSSVWAYRKIQNRSGSEYTTLSNESLVFNITKFRDEYDLRDEDGRALRINLSRIRKTYINGIYSLSGEDLLVTAQQAKHINASTTDNHYLVAPESSKRSLGIMGEIRVKQLLGDEIQTPMAHCKDNKNGTICTDFLGCFRCKSFVITGDDLYKIFSLYWAIMRSRDGFGRKYWKRYLRHILRVIDEEVVPEFAKHNLLHEVEATKARAKHTPHPFWKNLDMLRFTQ